GSAGRGLGASVPSAFGPVVRRDADRSTTAGGARVAAVPGPPAGRTKGARIAANRASVSRQSARGQLSPLRVRRFPTAEGPILDRRAPAGSHAPIARSPLPAATTP